MAKQKSWFGVWGGVKPADLNRLLKPYGCRLLAKGRRQDDQVLVTAEPLDVPRDGLALAQAAERALACVGDNGIITDSAGLLVALEDVRRAVGPAS